MFTSVVGRCTIGQCVSINFYKSTKMAKKLLVSSAVQVALFKEILLTEFTSGFWKDHRPANHGAQWTDVEVVVSETDELGPVNFTTPRLYNFVNPGFIKPNKERLIAIAQQFKSTSNFSSVKKELIELSCIVGGRLANKKNSPTKATRKSKGVSNETEVKSEVKVKKTSIKNPNIPSKRTQIV